MGMQNRLLSFAILTTLAALPSPARAACTLGDAMLEVVGLMIGTASMIVDTGFTIHAIVKGVQAPAYQDVEAARWQVGLMVPQIILTSGAILVTASCQESRAAVVVNAIPLAWSIGLLGHGIWVLTKPSAVEASEPPPQGLPMPATTHTSARLTVLPAALGPRGIGFRLQGQF